MTDAIGTPKKKPAGPKIPPPIVTAMKVQIPGNPMDQPTILG